MLQPSAWHIGRRCAAASTASIRLVVAMQAGSATWIPLAAWRVAQVDDGFPDLLRLYPVADFFFARDEPGCWLALTMATLSAFSTCPAVSGLNSR